MSIKWVLLLLAFLTFAISAFLPNPPPRVNFTALGLAFWTLSLLVG